MAEFRLRIQFAKCGAALWLSHLEVVRSMERLVRRSGLPYAISQGFSPHLKHSFSAALPVGTGSTGEYMDVELASLVDPKRALEALKAGEHPNLPVLAATYAAKDEPSLQVYFNAATYCVSFTDPAEDIAPELLTRLQNTKEVEVIKKGKPKIYELAKYLEQSELLKDQTGCHLEDNGGLKKGSVLKAPVSSLALTMLSRPEGALRPEVLLAALAKPDIDLVITSLTRTHLKHREL